MTPKEIKQARRDLGFSIGDLACALLLSPASGNRTIRRWEAGDVPITGPAIIAIQAMLEGYMPAHFEHMKAVYD